MNLKVIFLNEQAKTIEWQRNIDCLTNKMRIFKENNKKDKLKNKQVKQLNKIARFNKERTRLEEIKN